LPLTQGIAINTGLCYYTAHSSHCILTIICQY